MTLSIKNPSNVFENPSNGLHKRRSFKGLLPICYQTARIHYRPAPTHLPLALIQELSLVYHHFAGIYHLYPVQSSDNRQTFAVKRPISIPAIYRFFTNLFRLSTDPGKRLRNDYCLYVVFHCATGPSLNIIRNPSMFDWLAIAKVEYYRLGQDSVKHTVELKEGSVPYRTGGDS